MYAIFTYGDYVYINNENNAPEEHHIQSILKTKSDIYITSLQKLMNESLKYLTKLFVGKIIKEWMFEYVKFVSHISNVVKWNKESDDMESM